MNETRNGAPRTEAGQALLRANTGVWGADHQKHGPEVMGMREAILAIEQEAAHPTATTRGSLAAALLESGLIDRLLDYAKTGENRYQVAKTWADHIADWLDYNGGSWEAARPLSEPHDEQKQLESECRCIPLPGGQCGCRCHGQEVDEPTGDLSVVGALPDRPEPSLNVERLRRIQVERLLAELVEAIAEFSNDPYQKWPEYRDARAYFRGEFQPPDPATAKGVDNWRMLRDGVAASQLEVKHDG